MSDATPVVLIQDDGTMIFDDATERAWESVQSAAACLADHYRDGLEIRYENNRHAPLLVPSGLNCEKVAEYFAHWSIAVSSALNGAL